MYHGLYGKFTQNEDLYNLLLNTENRFIIYKTENDWTWGTGYDSKGLYSNISIMNKLICRATISRPFMILY